MRTTPHSRRGLSEALANRHALAILLASATTACSSIPEGRSAIDSVDVVNAHALDARDVQDKLATAESHKFAGLFRGLFYDYEVFDASMLQRDLARVERTYRGHGFFEARARAARVVHVSPTHVRVEILVDEGPPMLDRELRIDGLEGLPAPIADAVRAAAFDALPKGTRFDEEAYGKAKAAVARTLSDHGYAYATVEADAQADLAAHAIDYTFTVRAGPQAVLGPITIVRDTEGDAKADGTPIEEAALRRAMNLYPGEPFSTATIEAATQALLDLEVLASVQIVPVLSDPPSPVVPLTVRVQPSKMHATRLGGGLEFDEIKTDVHGVVGWEDHDFYGDLRDFSVDFKPGVVLYPMRVNNFVAPTNPLLEERLKVQLKQPGFLEPRTSVFVRPEMNVFPMLVAINPPADQPVLGYVEPKMSVGVERRFGKHVLTTLAYALQGELPFAYTSQLATPIPGVVLSSLQLVTKIDFRDNPIHPHAGAYFANDLQVAGGPLGGSASDIRVQPEARGYVPLGRRVTLATRGTVGLLFASNYGDYIKQNHYNEPQNPNSFSSNRFYNAIDRDIEIMLFRGFTSGGPSSNRGYPLRAIAPQGIVPFLSPAAVASQQNAGGVSCLPGQASSNSQSCAVPIGGFSLWEASAEVRFEVTGPLGVAVFCDMGDVAPAQATLRWDHVHLSCGAGMRYDTPVGPIRLDVGYRLTQVIGGADDLSVPSLFNNVPMALSFGIGETY
jgi:outer membrane protein insertion porin family/translocation and assembly module TamA